MVFDYKSVLRDICDSEGPFPFFFRFSGILCCSGSVNRLLLINAQPNLIYPPRTEYWYLIYISTLPMVIRLLLYANARPSYHIRAEYVYTNKTTNENKTHSVLSCLKKKTTHQYM